ncbi:hypothetical protein SO802_016618 [Lithocarpus litseifolius]|uniref:CCHC-type domain-containing protein n=1 Tax=Lithocarpus litseifolius TaxID=425828 RepID=A0AAW2CZ55_9ROSI
MEHIIIDSLKNLQLTKEEEEDIFISSNSTPDLLEECTLSLFGRLLADCNQNQRALKNTLRPAWKLGSDLRIVEVGNNILQFKFSSMYQLEWVERSGPWNFENNLLLLCRWRRGLSSANLVFTHAPFWVQVWGLPFEHMNEEAGREIGGKIGRVIEVDKRSWQADQAKFIRVRIDLPIEKPLRRGGYVTNMDGERCWVSFKYERLPTFCFTCGKIGHDEKHCGVEIEKQPLERQYGEWMRARGVSKGANEGSKVAGNSSHEQRSGDESRKMSQATVGELDNNESEKHNLSKNKGPRSPQKVTKEVTKGELVKELFKPNDDELSMMGWSIKTNCEEQESTTPLKPKSNKENGESGAVLVGPSKRKEKVGKVKIKKSAREVGKAQSAGMKTQEILLGTKRRENTEELAASEGQLQKKSYDGEGKKTNFLCDETAVAARQHRREQ